jgi:hypothetical protein
LQSSWKRSYSDPILPPIDSDDDSTEDASDFSDGIDDRFTDRNSDETDKESLYDASPLACYGYIPDQSKDECEATAQAIRSTDDQHRLDAQPEVRSTLSSAVPAFEPRGLARVCAQVQARLPFNPQHHQHGIDHQQQQNQQNQQQQLQGASYNSGSILEFHQQQRQWQQQQQQQQQLVSTNGPSPAINMQGRPMRNRAALRITAPAPSLGDTGGWLPAASAGKAASQVAYQKELQRTTVMVRNIPNNYTRDMFLSMLNHEGFAGMYDFVYLPIDFLSRASLGYAFVNLTSSKTVKNFLNAFAGYTRWMIPTKKVGYVTCCGTHQGLDAHVERYRNSPVMHEAIPDEFKPIILKKGRRVAFPAPTRVIRAPRIRDRPDSLT